MKNSFFTDENQLKKWVEAAVNIKESFGIDKALGYLIGEKFYNIIRIRYSAQEMINTIDEQRKRPNYNPIREGKGEFQTTMNLDEVYEKEIKKIDIVREVAIEFADLIKDSFEPHEIWQYLYSNPRLGALGHVCTEKEHKFMVEKGAVEHSAESEIKDALILGEIKKYLEVDIE